MFRQQIQGLVLREKTRVDIHNIADARVHAALMRRHVLLIHFKHANDVLDIIPHVVVILYVSHVALTRTLVKLTPPQPAHKAVALLSFFFGDTLCEWV